MLAFLAWCVAVIACGRLLRERSSLRAPDVVARTAVVVVAVVVAVLSGPSGIVLVKVAGRALLPLGLVWVVVVGVALGRAILRDASGALRAGVLVVVVSVIGNEPLGELACAALEAPYRADPFAGEPLDAVFVLGGGAQKAPYDGGAELGPSGDRVLLGARLWHRGRAPLLVTSGTPIDGLASSFDSTRATTTLWRDVGVPDAAIVLLANTRTTSEEAAAAAPLVRARGWRRVGLVSSAWHLRRATRLFERAGVEVVPLAADHRGTPRWEGLFSVVPTGSGAWLQQKAAWEWLGAAMGR